MISCNQPLSQGDYRCTAISPPRWWLMRAIEALLLRLARRSVTRSLPYDQGEWATSAVTQGHLAPVVSSPRPSIIGPSRVYALAHVGPLTIHSSHYRPQQGSYPGVLDSAFVGSVALAGAMGVAFRTDPSTPLHFTLYRCPIFEKGGVGRKRVRSRRNSSQLSGETPDRKGVKHRRKCPACKIMRTTGRRGFSFLSFSPIPFQGSFFSVVIFPFRSFVFETEYETVRATETRRTFRRFSTSFVFPPLFCFPFSLSLFNRFPPPCSSLNPPLLCFLTSSFPAPFPHFFNPPSVPTFSPPSPFLQ